MRYKIKFNYTKPVAICIVKIEPAAITSQEKRKAPIGGIRQGSIRRYIIMLTDVALDLSIVPYFSSRWIIIIQFVL